MKAGGSNSTPTRTPTARTGSPTFLHTDSTCGHADRHLSRGGRCRRKIRR